MRFHFICGNIKTIIVAPPIVRQDVKHSISREWIMYHQELEKSPPKREIVEEVIIQWDRGRTILKLPFPFRVLEFEAYAYYVEPKEEIKKTLKSGDRLIYTPLELRIIVSEKQFNMLASSLGGKYLEHL